MNSISRFSSALTNFKNINSKNGKYISNNIFNRKNIIAKIKVQSSLLISQKRKQKWNNVFKKIHDFRLSKLQEVQDVECVAINEKLQHTNIANNQYLQFEVTNNEELNDDLNNLLKDYQDQDIEQIITQEFTGNGREIANRDLFIDKKKLNKIAEDDFTIALKKIINKIETPKELKYLYDFIANLKSNNKVNIKVVDEIHKTLNKKTKNIYKELLAATSHDPETTLEDFHALIAICNMYNIDISSYRKQTRKLCLHYFNKVADRVNDNSRDITIIKQQQDNLFKLKNGVVNYIIRNTSTNIDADLAKVNGKFAFVQNWVDLVINKHNNLIRDLQRNTKKSIANSNLIPTLINNNSDLFLKYTEVNKKLSRTDLSKKQLTALRAVKQDIHSKYKQSLLELNTKCKLFYDSMDTNRDKRRELQQHIQTYKNIPAEELADIPLDDSQLLEQHLHQQINDKINNLPTNVLFTNLLQTELASLERKYNKIMSLMLVNSILTNIRNNDNLVTAFQQKAERVTQAIDLDGINKKYFTLDNPE